MNLCFLGTGHGVPEAGKKCTASLLQVGDNYYIIDAGCDVAYELSQKRIPFEKVKAVFITHSHGDHTNGLVPFLDIIAWYHTSCNPAVYLPSDWCTKCFTEHILPGKGLSLRPEQSIQTYPNGLVYDDGVIRVTSFPTQHCGDSHGFLVEAEGKRLLFTGDLKNPKIDFPPVDDLDVAVVEGAHFYISDYEEPFSEKKIKAAYVHHYGNYIGLMNHQHLRPLQKACPHMKITLATDGMEINV